MSGSYEQVLHENGPLPVDDVIALGIAIGSALHVVHQAGRVHGDVRPATIELIDEQPALSDAGQPDDLIPHASPEVLLGQARTGLSDVYSLASSMWTLLTGHPPFLPPGGAPPDLAAFRDRVLHDPLPPLPGHVPAWLAAELIRALATRPAQRHPSAQDFADALRHAGAPAVAATPPTGPRPTETASLPPGLIPVTPSPEDPTPDPGELDQAGWLGSVPLGGSAIEPEAPDPIREPAAEPPPARPPDQRRSGRVLTGAVGLIVVAAAGSLAALLAANHPVRPAPPASPSVITPVADGAPGDVRLTDNGASVTLSWSDPSRGAVPFLVTGAPAGGSPLPLRNLVQGTSSVSYGGLDPHANYCFVVAAVYSVNRVATAPRTCTTR